MIINNKAFSLVELLVTTAVGAILVSMSTAQFQIYREKANDLISLTALNNARTGVEALFADRAGSDNGNMISFEYFDDGTTLHYYANELVPNEIGIPGYTHTKGVNLNACSIGINDPHGTYYIRSFHEEGATRLLEGGRRGGGSYLSHLTNLYISNVGITLAAYPSPLEFWTCPKPVVPLP